MRKTVRTIGLALIIGALILLCAACGTEPATAWELVERDYYDWASSSEYAFIWQGARYRAGNIREYDEKALNTFGFLDKNARVELNETARECVITAVEGRGDYYLLTSPEYPSVVLLIPRRAFQGILGDAPRPLAFCLTRAE